MSAHEPAAEPPPADPSVDVVGDLDVREGEDVSGGSLNAYVSKLQGEKQGAIKGG